MGMENMGFFGGVGSTIAGYTGAKNNRKAIDRARQQQLGLIQSLDWEPEYTSNNITPYQKTQSPVAGAWLDSYLMGDNPASINPNAPNAALLKRQAQERQSQNFGTPEERLAQQQQIYASNPYPFKTPERAIMNDKTKEAAYGIANPHASSFGIDGDLYKKLVAGGYVQEGQDIFPALDGHVGDKGAKNYSTALKNALEAGDKGAVDALLHPNYEGHGMAQHIRQRRKAKKIAGLIDRYDGEG